MKKYGFFSPMVDFSLKKPYNTAKESIFETKKSDVPALFVTLFREQRGENGYK